MRKFLFVFLLFCGVCSAEINSWSAVGPYGITSGDFTFHPTDSRIIFLSGEEVFRSEDAGATWKQLDLLPGAYTVQYPYVLRIHPANPERILAVSYPAFESLDRGSTWTQIARIQFPGIREIEFDPLNPNIVWAVHSRQAVLRTEDGGKTWLKRNQGLPILDYCCGYQLEINPHNPKNLFVLHYLPRHPPTVYKTTNAGESWISVSSGLPSSGDLYSLEMDAEKPQTLYASGSNGIFKTVNGGKQWSKLPCDCASRFLSADPKRSGILYASLIKEPSIIKSLDGGKTWRKLPVPLLNRTFGFGRIGINPLSPDSIYVTGDGVVYRSLNGGNSWQRFTRGLQGVTLSRLVTHRQLPGRIYAAAGRLYRTTNSGSSWNIVEVPGLVTQDFSDLQIHPQNPNFQVAAGIFQKSQNSSGQAFLFTSDGGKSWQPRSPYLGSSIVALDPRSQQNIYAYASSANFIGMVRSTDSGRTWQNINQGLPRHSVRSIQFSSADSSRLFILCGFRLFRSMDRGNQWEKLPNRPGESFLEIEMDPQNPLAIYALTLIPRERKQGAEFRKSTDEGKTWKTLSRTPPIVAFDQNAIRIDPSNPEVIYLATYGGILVSVDAGNSWNFFDVNGMSGIYSMWTRDLLVKPWGTPEFFRANYRGVFRYSRVTTSAAPVIRGVSSTYAAPSEAIKIVGHNFGVSPGSVFVGDTAVTSIHSWSETQIEVSLPDQVRTGSISVVARSVRSNPQLLVIALPGIFPHEGPSAGGNIVAIAGERDFPNWDAIHAFFGNVLAHDATYVAPAVIVANSPSGTGTVPVILQSNGGLSGDFGSYTYE